MARAVFNSVAPFPFDVFNSDNKDRSAFVIGERIKTQLLVYTLPKSHQSDCERVVAARTASGSFSYSRLLRLSIGKAIFLTVLSNQSCQIVATGSVLILDDRPSQLGFVWHSVIYSSGLLQLKRLRSLTHWRLIHRFKRSDIKNFYSIVLICW